MQPSAKSPQTCSGAGPADTGTSLVPLRDPSIARSSAATISPALAYRSEGLLASAFITELFTPAGSPARDVVSERGSSVRLRVMMARAVGPVKGGSPAIISYITAPSA